MRNHKKSKLFYLAGICLFTTAFFLSSIGSIANAAPKKITLTLNLFIAPTHTRWTHGLKPWFDELEKRTDGKLKIRPYFAQALSKLPEVYDSVVDGRADIGESFLGMPPGRWLLVDVISSNAMTSATMMCRKPSTAFNRLYSEQSILQERFKETKVLFFHVGSPTVFGSAEKPLKGIKDVTGLKVNAMPHEQKKLGSLGMVPVNLPPMEIYTSLQKGVIAASGGTFEIMVARKWADNIKHMVANVQTGRPVFVLFMNRDVWNRLPNDIQAVADKMGQKAIGMMDDYWWNSEIKAVKKFQTKYGGKVYKWSEEDIAKAKDKFEIINNQKIDKVESKGYPARKIVKRYVELENEYAVKMPY